MLTHRLARDEDLPQLRRLADLAIDTLQRDVLTPRQVAASREIMGIDSQLVADGTYFVIERDGLLAGCGGWSKRRTTYGGDHSAGRDQTLLDPDRDPARIRAMYTHPDHVRRGVGRLILSLSEEAARPAGFRSLELLATLTGVPLFRSYGFVPFEDVVEEITGTGIPLVRMRRTGIPLVRMRKTFEHSHQATAIGGSTSVPGAAGFSSTQVVDVDAGFFRVDRLEG